MPFGGIAVTKHKKNSNKNPSTTFKQSIKHTLKSISYAVLACVGAGLLIFYVDYLFGTNLMDGGENALNFILAIIPLIFMFTTIHNTNKASERAEEREQERETREQEREVQAQKRHEELLAQMREDSRQAREDSRQAQEKAQERFEALMKRMNERDDAILKLLRKGRRYR